MAMELGPESQMDLLKELRLEKAVQKVLNLVNVYWAMPKAASWVEKMAGMMVGYWAKPKVVSWVAKMVGYSARKTAASWVEKTAGMMVGYWAKPKVVSWVVKTAWMMVGCWAQKIAMMEHLRVEKTAWTTVRELGWMSARESGSVG